MDKDKNIILTSTEEYRLEKSGTYAKGSPWFLQLVSLQVLMLFRLLGRYVGMVMVPWRYVVKVEVEMIDWSMRNVPLHSCIFGDIDEPPWPDAWLEDNI
jgi:hypothetical protein